MWFLFSVALMCPASVSLGEVGVRQMTVFSQARGTELEVMVWYPASAGGQAITTGESKFFKGTPALRDAPVSRGRFPLVLLSHGAELSGSVQAASWLAVPLAARGFIVAGPAHPGNTGPSHSAADTMKL